MKRFSIMNCPARAGRLGVLLLVLPFFLSSCVSYDSWNRTTYNPQNEKLHRRETKRCLPENEAYP